MLSTDELIKLKTKDDLLNYIQTHKGDDRLFQKVYNDYLYEEELKALQCELVTLQKWVIENKKKVAIIFEGRDASGKGGTIRRFAEHLNPRALRVVALNKPTEVERHQWYFNRYIQKLPNAGEIVLFDRSWYNRAVVEPVMDFCTQDQYDHFMVQVPEFEHMLYESGTIIIKFWFSVSKEEQQKRFGSRLKSELKKWKYSPVDEKGQELWDKYSFYKNQMFTRTHNSFSPWIIVKSDNKKQARLESIKYVLSLFDYGNQKSSVLVDPNIVYRFFRSINQIDQ